MTLLVCQCCPIVSLFLWLLSVSFYLLTFFDPQLELFFRRFFRFQVTLIILLVLLLLSQLLFAMFLSLILALFLSKCTSFLPSFVGYKILQVFESFTETCCWRPLFFFTSCGWILLSFPSSRLSCCCCCCCFNRSWCSSSTSSNRLLTWDKNNGYNLN